MIEKMKFLSITGPKADIDRMTETYLSRYEIHLETPLQSSLKSRICRRFWRLILTKII